MDLQVSTRPQHGYTVVVPQGEIDLSTVDVFRAQLNELLIQGRVHLLVDFDETTFLDSLGIGALIAARRKAYAFNGSMGIVCSSPRILNIFKVTGLDRIFLITPTVLEQPARAVDAPELR